MPLCATRCCPASHFKKEFRHKRRKKTKSAFSRGTASKASLSSPDAVPSRLILIDGEKARQKQVTNVPISPTSSVVRLRPRNYDDLNKAGPLRPCTEKRAFSMTQPSAGTPRTSRPPQNLEREESQLWRWILLFMVLLAAGFAALAWERLQGLPYHLGPLAIGVLILSVLLAVYAYGRRREVLELKTLLQGLQEHVGAAPSEEQLDQLNEMIARSQRSFKELIDSIDEAACAVSLDGTLRTVNKSVSELIGQPYTAIVGHKYFEFIDEPSRASLEAGLARFLEKRHWAGTIRLRLKNNGRPRYFDCVLNAIVKGDEVVGVSALGRDVTEQHEKELRFTELFETLQEGAYFSTPEGRLLDANPALVSLLGYASKEELLALDPSQLNVDSAEPPVLGRAPEDRGGVRAREISLRKKDGTAVSLLESSRAVWDSSGKLIR